MIVPLIGAGVKGKSVVTNAQRRLNCYLEPQYDQDKSRVAVFGTPGTVQVLSNGATPFRGGLAEGELLYLAQGSVFYEVNNAFIVTDRNSASRLTTTTGKVVMASSSNVIVLVDGTNGYNYTISGASFAQIVSAMFSSPRSVTWQDGYFLASFDETGTNKKRCQISADGVTWNALDFRAVETVPGALIRTYSFNGEVHQFTDKGIEFWAYTGDPTFPFQPIRGASLRVGLDARHSVSEGAEALYFLGRRHKGEAEPFRLIGHEAQSISTPDMQKIINDLASTGDAVGYVYSIDGHEFYVLSWPVAGVTWMYDGYASGLLGVPVWSELQSNNGRHVGEFAFTLVNRIYVTDYTAGKLHRVDKGVYTDNGSAIAWQLDTRHFFKDYDSVTVDELVADFEAGVGLNTGQGSDPLVMIQVSRDAGKTWGAERHVPMGKVGEYTRRAAASRFGTARDFVFRLRITDPVKRVLGGLAVRASPEQVRQVA